MFSGSSFHSTVQADEKAEVGVRRGHNSGIGNAFLSSLCNVDDLPGSHILNRNLDLLGHPN